MPSAASPGPRPPLRAKHAVSAPEPGNGPLSLPPTGTESASD